MPSSTLCVATCSAVRIQLFRRRRALRAIQAEVDSAGLRWRSSAGPPRSWRCRSRDRRRSPSPGRHRSRCDLRARRVPGASVAEVAVADPEQADVARLRPRHEGFFADRREIALAPLHAERAVPAGRSAGARVPGALRWRRCRTTCRLRRLRVRCVRIPCCASFRRSAGERPELVDAAAHSLRRWSMSMRTPPSSSVPGMP